jgi:hypothetical protein
MVTGCSGTTAATVTTLFLPPTNAATTHSGERRDRARSRALS